ncbi:helix-turn-helix domain-containing protein [Enterococcus raffinosus]|uniref:Helix-turn-helix domain-containing protein n=1 Tax=Enterococcus raffinosus TaxID=71452 RepID=A0AAW8TDL5_9ENTE|nr:helix-turn-helix domain-containing protein [Enterococcus raffinosus]MDT2523860.1 helix-turn-helix domain-containing protein [Enterococcus raffinosus]MDT2534612.1 helix-turn-helix domain-containing protein [Enterococcus raffinosus]MDT2544997.1 helix-turn-helix domain-containing protein [Enterococcus raffinosus]MDT2591245.1 helix-turn-helix domain-containing protein [Enterococcus raffinosus]
MIDNFIEKDILRRVKITYVLYDCRQIKIGELAANMNTSFNTIKKDCQKIAARLEEDIGSYSITRSQLSFHFKQGVTCYDLVRKMYSDSLFLKVCYRCLLGNNNYTSIAEEEFISVTKVFNLKKKAEIFFRQGLGSTPEGKIAFENELKVRYIYLTLWMRGIGVEDLKKNPLFAKSEQIAHDLGDLLKNHLSSKSLHYLRYAVFLSITKKSRLPIDGETIKFLKTGILFNSIKTCFSQHEITLDDENIAFISFIYKNLPYNPESYRLIEVDYQYYRNRLINSHPSVVQLIRQFEAAFEMNLLGEIEFEKPLMDLVYTTSLGINEFLLNQYYFINCEDRGIKEKISQIVFTWIKENFSEQLMMSESIILQFCHLVMPILKKGAKKKLPIIIVAKDEYSHMLFRNNISKIISENYFFINDEIYYSIEDIPELFFNIPCFIVCERCLLNQEQDFILPISINHLISDLKDISNYIFTCVLTKQ